MRTRWRPKLTRKGKHTSNKSKGLSERRKGWTKSYIPDRDLFGRGIPLPAVEIC